MSMLAASGIRPIVDYAAEDDVEAAAPAAAAPAAVAPVGADADGKPGSVPLRPAREGAVGRVYDYEDERTCDRWVGAMSAPATGGWGP